MRGDLLFYTPTDPWMWLIAHATNGPYAHVAIDLGDGTVIEAVNSGVHHDYATLRGVPWHMPPGHDVQAGIRWLYTQLGHAYGWGDIIDQAQRILGIKHGVNPDRDDYDCSDLATRYLLKCGVPVGPLAANPALVSPNDLARQLHLI